MSELWVRRMTWKFAQPKPTGDNFGRKCRRQQLCLDTGVVSRSEGNIPPAAGHIGEMLADTSTWRGKPAAFVIQQ